MTSLEIKSAYELYGVNTLVVSFRYFALVLLTICCRELVAERSGFENPHALTLVVALLLCVSLITKFAALRAVAGATLAGTSFAWLARELFHLSRVKIEQLWCYASPIVLLMLGWIKWSCLLEQAGWPQSLMLALCFLPTLLFLMMVELIAAQVDCVGKSPMTATTLQTWLTRVRLGEIAGLLTCLVPVLLLTFIADVTNFVSTTWGVESSVVSTTAAALLVVSFITIFPIALTRWSAGKALPEILGQRVDGLLRASKVNGIRSVLISSNGRWAGAAVVGWIRGCRRLWLGDGLLSILTPREVDMVVLHEAAHVTRYHFFWRLMPVVWATAAGAVVWLVGDSLGMVESLTCKLLAGVSSSLIMLIGLGRVARRCELDADCTACDLALVATDWATNQSPANVMSSALSKLLEGSASAEITWLHPSLDQRLAALDQWNAASELKVIPNASNALARA